MNLEVKEIEIRDLRPNNGQVEGLPKNPRKISKKQLEKLKKSLEDAPEMLHLRELICVEHPDGPVVIAGNQRLEAAKALGWKTLPCKVLPADTDPAKMREYAIKDNLPFGEDDWEVIANDWDNAELEEWGMEVPEFIGFDADFDPSILSNLSAQSINDTFREAVGMFQVTLLFPEHIKELYNRFVKEYDKDELTEACITKIQECYA